MVGGGTVSICGRVSEWVEEKKMDRFPRTRGDATT